MNKLLLERIRSGSKSYQESVVNMSDAELYFHVFGDGDFKEEDFAYQELVGRGIDQFIPCYACQGGGCPVCNGYGKIPTFQ